MLNTLYERTAINAWHKCLQWARAWLVWLLLALLPRLRHCQPSNLATVTGRVLLVDVSRFKRRKTGSGWQLHSAYYLQQGRLQQVCESDQYQAESLEHFDLQREDVIIADRSYGYPRNVAYASERQAYVVFGFMPSTCSLFDRRGQPLDVVGWLRQAKRGTHSRKGWCEYEGKRYQVRIIAQALRQENAPQLGKRKEQQTDKQSQQLQEDTLVLASWVLLLCTLPKHSWPPKQVLLLYGTRSQLELVFRRMKQVVQLYLMEEARTAQSYKVRVSSSTWWPRSCKKRKLDRRAGSCNTSSSSFSRPRCLHWSNRQRSSSQ